MTDEMCHTAYDLILRAPGAWFELREEDRVALRTWAIENRYEDCVADFDKWVKNIEIYEKMRYQGYTKKEIEGAMIK